MEKVTLLVLKTEVHSFIVACRMLGITYKFKSGFEGSEYGSLLYEIYYEYPGDLYSLGSEMMFTKMMKKWH